MSWLAGVVGPALLGAVALGDGAVGVTSDGRLVTFDTSTPSTIERRTLITGLQTGETILGVDFRPADGKLYAVGSSNRLYVIDRATGAATQVGTGTFAVALTGTDFGVDFDPVSDRLRVVSASDQNLRIDPATGQVVGSSADTNVAYAALDSNFLANPSVVALAYDRNVAGGTASTLFGIDSTLGVLVRVGDVDGTPLGANGGALHTIGPIGTPLSGSTAFDIAGTTAFAAITAPAATSTNLYTVDLTTGTATLVGAIGGTPIHAMAIVPVRFTGITVDDQLITFAATSPAIVSAPVAVTGLQTSEHIVAASVRPATGRLYALGGTGRLYRVNETTGAATQVGGPAPALTLTGTDFAMDFDPVKDAIRVVSDADVNLRIDPDTAQIIDGDTGTAGAQPDANLAFAAGDPNAAANPTVIAISYDSNRAGVAATTLFGVDQALDVLVRVGSVGGTPDSAATGKLTTIGPLGVDVGSRTSFDLIGGTGATYGAMSAPAGASTDLYTINLGTGAATLVGTIGGGKALRAVTAEPVSPLPVAAAVDLVALTTVNSLVSVNSGTPGSLSAPVLVTGLAGGENLVAIDVRPSTGVLYGVSDQNHLYAINHTTGAAILVGTASFSPALNGTAFGMDFDPHSDTIRVVSDSGQNLRIDPATGSVIDGDTLTPGVQTDTDLAFAAADPNFGTVPHVVGAAYDRDVAAAPATTLFGIDAGLDVLVRQGDVDGTPASPNSGTLTTIGPLGIDATSLAGFEIAPGGAAFAGIVVGGTSGLFQVDLSTGATTLVGQLFATPTLRGLAIAPTADPAPAVKPLNVRTLTILLNFCGPFNRDSITMTGTLPAPVGSVTNKSIAVDVGGASKSFVLDVKKHGVTGDDRFQFVGKASKQGTMNFTVTFKKEQLADEFADEGLNADTSVTKAARQVVVTVTFDGTVYQSTVDLTYTAKIRHNGIAKKHP